MIMVFKRGSMGKRICNQTRKLLAGVSCITMFLQYYYQVLRMSLLLTLDLIGSKLAASIREECATVDDEIFHYIFTFYRLSRMLLLLTLDFIGRKVTMISIRIRMRKYKQKHSELQGYQSTSSKWSTELPEDMMQLVLQQPQLCISDHRRCGAVCHSWRVAVARSNTSTRGGHLASHELPWLMLCSPYFVLKDHRFLSLSDQKIYKSNPTNYINNIECVGSIEGWLIMVDSIFRRPEGFMNSSVDGIAFFLNPISGARVMLPSQSTIPSHDESNCPNFLLKVKASPAPTSQHCVVAALYLGNHLAFCRPSDKSWTLIDRGRARKLEFIDMAIIEGKLYAATWDASQFIMVFDIQNANGSSPRAKRLVMLHPMPVPSHTVTRNGLVSDLDLECIYLSQDSTSKELFMIFRRSIFSQEEDPIIPWHTLIGYNCPSLPQNAGFRVFKLKHRNGPRWVEVVNLGCRTLFITNSDSKVIPAARGFNRTHNTLRANCIYFAFEIQCVASPSSGYDAGVFSLTKKTIRRYAFFKDHSRTRFCVRPIWFTPSP